MHEEVSSLLGCMTEIYIPYTVIKEVFRSLTSDTSVDQAAKGTGYLTWKYTFSTSNDIQTSKASA